MTLLEIRGPVHVVWMTDSVTKKCWVCIHSTVSILSIMSGQEDATALLWSYCDATLIPVASCFFPGSQWFWKMQIRLYPFSMHSYPSVFHLFQK